MSSPWIDAALIDMCIKCGRSGDAHLLFEQWQHEESFHIAWNSLLLASVRDGEYEKTFSTFLQMFRSSGVEFIDEFMLTAVLGVCGSLGFAEPGKQMHSFVAKSGLLCARGVGNAIISMYGKCGELKDAANFFEPMTCRDLVSWNAMVTAHLLLHQGDEILKIWSEMERLMIRPDSITFLLEFWSYLLAVTQAQTPQRNAGNSFFLCQAHMALNQPWSTMQPLFMSLAAGAILTRQSSL